MQLHLLEYFFYFKIVSIVYRDTVLSSLTVRSDRIIQAIEKFVSCCKALPKLLKRMKDLNSKLSRGISFRDLNIYKVILSKHSDIPSFGNAGTRLK